MGLWPKLALYISTKINNGKEVTYLHKSMLNPVYSADQKWEGTSANTLYVAADMVAMDSPLPIKKRGSVATSNGKLPKVGMKKKKGETDLNTLDLMVAQYQSMAADNQRQAQAAQQKQRIIQQFANDALYCSVGIDEKNEANFLTALSDGVMAVPDSENTGTALRVNFGYDKFPQNHFGVEVLGHISREDIERVLDKANDSGVAISTIAISLATYRQMKSERWARELVATAREISYTAETSLPVPNATAFDQAFADEFGGIEFLKIDRTVYIEKNGIDTPIKPFNANKLVFLSSTMVGSLVWGTLAEASRPVAGVQYTTVDDYKLIAEYSTTDPLTEHTTGQALVIPVIENVDKIFTLDKSNAFEVDPNETDDTDDVMITIKGKRYMKSQVVTGLAALGVTISATAADKDFIKAINKLSDKDEAALIKGLTQVYIYEAVESPSGNPKEKGYYERSGSAGSYVYTLSTDTTVSESKTYYIRK